MDQVTQQNAAMVEQSTAATHSLRGEANELRRLVGEFRTGETPASGGRVAAATPASRPTPSEPRRMTERLQRAYGGGAATALKSDWEEF
jgi:methyl-accepting chemotaxis protein